MAIERAKRLFASRIPKLAPTTWLFQERLMWARPEGSRPKSKRSPKRRSREINMLRFTDFSLTCATGNAVAAAARMAAAGSAVWHGATAH